jgi:hypothetical protein
LNLSGKSSSYPGDGEDLNFGGRDGRNGSRPERSRAKNSKIRCGR